MKHKVIWLVAVVLSLMLCSYIYFNSAENKAHKVDNENSIDDKAIFIVKADAPASSSPSSPPAKKKPTIVESKSADSNPVNLELWAVSDKAKSVLQASDKLPADLAQEAYVQLDNSGLLNLSLGDSFPIAIPQLGTELIAEVDHITNHKNGDRTVEANFPGMSPYFSAVFTIGEKTTYAQISTPDGVFMLESQGDYAWIAPGGAMAANHWSDHQDGVHFSDDQPVDSNDNLEIDADIKSSN
ncbi:hypothetical protein [Pleionea sp. CnH1-48]|uniref:hypothetical protein n=1 Tax=Pleionea sp. CnH1-48 TaxID=2954494 RepID=UPI0020971069|nr:hypothetical protein [Pleionea sp. CnH1-48]MCO7226349.1 hypothetical protein [Pleionea sp. CnH1-48]